MKQAAPRGPRTSLPHALQPAATEAASTRARPASPRREADNYYCYCRFAPCVAYSRGCLCTSRWEGSARRDGCGRLDRLHSLSDSLCKNSRGCLCTAQQLIVAPACPPFTTVHVSPLSCACSGPCVPGLRVCVLWWVPGFRAPAHSSSSGRTERPGIFVPSGGFFDAVSRPPRQPPRSRLPLSPSRACSRSLVRVPGVLARAPGCVSSSGSSTHPLSSGRTETIPKMCRAEGTIIMTGRRLSQVCGDLCTPPHPLRRRTHARVFLFSSSL